MGSGLSFWGQKTLISLMVLSFKSQNVIIHHKSNNDGDHNYFTLRWSSKEISNTRGTRSRVRILPSTIKGPSLTGREDSGQTAHSMIVITSTTLNWPHLEFICSGVGLQRNPNHPKISLARGESHLKQEGDPTQTFHFQISFPSRALTGTRRACDGISRHLLSPYSQGHAVLPGAPGAQNRVTELISTSQA